MAMICIIIFVTVHIQSQIQYVTPHTFKCSCEYSTVKSFVLSKDRSADTGPPDPADSRKSCLLCSIIYLTKGHIIDKCGLPMLDLLPDLVEIYLYSTTHNS